MRRSKISTVELKIADENTMPKKIKKVKVYNVGVIYGTNLTKTYIVIPHNI